MKQTVKRFAIPGLLLAAFAAWTLALGFVDVRAIGPNGSAVGFGGINQLVHEITGVHFWLYNITDWLGLVPIAICLAFAVVGAVQWIRRRSLWRVDGDILLLGGFYLLTIAVFLLFENVVINYRPVLIEGFLEVSYPSSTTLLVMCVLPTTMLQCRNRLRHRTVKTAVLLLCGGFVAFMVVGRLISGVHWFSDIVGGALLSGGLVTLYHALCRTLCPTYK